MTARNLFAENTELTAEMFMSFLNVSFPSLLAAYKIKIGILTAATRATTAPLDNNIIG